MTNFERVQEWHQKFAAGQHVSMPQLRGPGTAAFRHRLINEELGELVEAMLEGDVVGIADALGDLLYVVYGTGDAYGFDMDAVFAEIHRSNMSKMGANGTAVYYPDGKVKKGPYYEPPDLIKVLGLVF